MTAISNFNHYNEAMKKSLLDKIFFIDKIEANVFIDYGCADGTLIKFLHIIFPEFIFIGFDISPEMIEEAKRNNPDIANNFFSNWEETKNKIKEIGGRNVIILSSIIHEVYSYSTSTEIKIFWDRVFSDIFDYVVIRDMIPSKTIEKNSDINDVLKIYRRANIKDLNDFERNWGSIENNKNLVHFLLKYRYSVNWIREVKENYLPIFREELLMNIPENYKILFHEHFVLPFLMNRVMEDFGIEIKDNTHLKLILRRNK